MQSLKIRLPRYPIKLIACFVMFPMVLFALSQIMIRNLPYAQWSDKSACLSAAYGLLDLRNGVYTYTAVADYQKTITVSPTGLYRLYWYPHAQTQPFPGVVYLQSMSTGEIVPLSIANQWQYMDEFWWSPDETQVAFLSDIPNRQAMAFTVLSADGKKSTREIPPPPGTGKITRSYFYGWSADWSYIAVSQEEDYSGQPRSTMYFYSFPDLDLVASKPDYEKVQWAPTGHRFFSSMGSDTVVIFTPDKHGGKEIYFSIAPETIQHRALLVLWSPDGLRVAVYGNISCKDSTDCDDGDTDIYGVDGSSIRHIPGRPLDLDTTYWKRASAWSADNRTWLVTRHRLANHQGPKTDLVAFQVDTQQTSTLATDIVDNFFGESPYYQERGRPIINGPGANQLLVPFRHGGHIDVILTDPRGQNRLVVVKDADELLNPNEWWNFRKNPAWSPGGTSVAVAWASGQGPYRQVRLTWMRTDGSARFETDGRLGIDDSFQDVRDVQWVGPYLLYRAKRSAGVSIESASLDKKRFYPLVLGNNDFWTAILSPDKQMLALAFGESVRTVYLVPLNSVEAAHPLSTAIWTNPVNPVQAVPYLPVWSPDSALLAISYAQPVDGGIAMMVDTITRDGLHANRYQTGIWPSRMQIPPPPPSWQRCQVPTREASLPPTPVPTSTPRPQPVALTTPMVTHYACLTLDSARRSVDLRRTGSVVQQEGTTNPVRQDFTSQGEYFYQRLLAWIQYGSRNAYLVDGQLVIVSPGEHLYRQFQLPGGPSPWAPQVVWSPDGRYLYGWSLQWSPDGRYILLQRYDDRNKNWHYDLFGIDGTQYSDVAVLPETAQTYTLSRSIWTADGNSVVFLGPPGNVFAFHITRDAYEPLHLDAPSPAPNVNTRRIAFPRLVNGKITIDLMDMDGRHRNTLVESADDAGDPAWSLDGQRVAVVWATGQGSARRVWLTWARADGSGRATLDTGRQDIRDILWIPDRNALAYISQDRDGFGVETLDLKTGKVQHLVTGLAQLVHLHYDASTDLFSFWWQDTAQHIHVSSYTFRGTRMYDAMLEDTFNAAQLFPSPYRWIWFAEMYPSPDGRVVAFRSDDWGSNHPNSERLQLIAADGQWSRSIRSDVRKIGNLVWSPDSKLLAFSQSNAPFQFTLEIVTAQGDNVGYIDSSGQGAWIPCDSAAHSGG